MYQPKDRVDEKIKGIAEVNVAKQRNGPTDLCRLAFVSKYARFADLEFQYPEV
jgi:replicative DNA helicase